MSLQIGRVGLDMTLEDPETWNHSGEEVSISGVLDGASIDDAKALRQQLLGLAGNPDEPVVPVVWDEDSFVDGFYEVVDVNVPTVPASLFAKWFPYSATLRRIQNYAQPLVESILAGPAPRANSHSYAGSGFSHGLPASAVGVRGEEATGPAILASEDGDIAIRNFGGPDTYTTIQYWVPPSDWYDGAPRYRIAYGAAVRTVVGRQHINEPRAGFWELANGMFKVVASHASNFELGISRWTGAAYSTVKKFQVGSQVASSIDVFPAPTTLNVIRNSPAVVVLRFTFDAELVGFWGIADLTLRRGAPFAELTVMTDGTNPAIGNTDWGVGRTTTEAASSLPAIVTGLDLIGIEATSNDGDGLKYVIGTPDTNSRDLANGELWLTNPAKRTTFLIGLARAADADLYDEPFELAGFFMGPRAETIRFIEQ